MVTPPLCNVKCSACTLEAAPIKVHGYDLCPRHSLGMMTAVLCGDFTPVGYIIAAACGADEPPPVPEFRAPKLPTKSAFMSHGALADPVLPEGLDCRGKAPGQLTAAGITEHRTVRVSSGVWRERA